MKVLHEISYIFRVPCTVYMKYAQQKHKTSQTTAFTSINVTVLAESDNTYKVCQPHKAIQFSSQLSSQNLLLEMFKNDSVYTLIVLYFLKTLGIGLGTDLRFFYDTDQNA